MAEEDLTWMLKCIGKSLCHFETLYSVNFKIPNIICLKNGEPKFWFYMDKDHNIRTKDEELLKFKVIKEFFLHPNKSDNYLYEALMGDFNETFSFSNKEKKDVFYVVMRIFGMDNKESKIIKKVREDIIHELFNNPSEIQDFFSQWIKIFPCFDEKGPNKLGLFELKYSKESKDGKGMTKCFRKKFNPDYIELFDFLKTENMKLLKAGSQKQLTQKIAEEKVFKVLSNEVLEKTEYFTNALVRFIENKSKRKFSSVNLEIFIDSSNQIWLIGCENIHFFNDEGEIDLNFDKTKFDFKTRKLQKSFYDNCHGIYCNYEHEIFRFYEENKEDENIYIKHENPKIKNIKERRKSSFKNSSYAVQEPFAKKKKNKIYYKSILLDYIERKKTKERIKEACPNMDQLRINTLSEFFFLKCRKFYSMSDLTKNEFFKHNKFSNLYEKVRVCPYCELIYRKMDLLRNKSLENEQQNFLSKEEIAKEIVKLTNFSSGGLVSTEEREKRLFTKKFEEKVKSFDLLENEQKNMRVVVSRKEHYFERLFRSKYNNLPSDFLESRDSDMPSFERPSHFILPIVYKESAFEKNEMARRDKIFIKKKDEENLGIKHLLGHTFNLPYSDSGLAISKSTYRLNQLQDKISSLDNVKRRNEQMRLKEIREEIKLLNFPYLGKGRFDYTKLEEVLNELRKKEVETPQSSISHQINKSIQVATDKDEFLSEEKKKLKLDKLLKAKELYLSKKNFLETHNFLSESVLRRNLFSPDKVTNNSNSPREFSPRKDEIRF